MENDGNMVILYRLDMRRGYSMNEGKQRWNSPEPEIYSWTTPEAVTLISTFVFPFGRPWDSIFLTRSMLSSVTSPEIEMSVEE